MLNICDSTGILSNLIHQPVCVHICQSQLSECCHLPSPDRCITVEEKFIFIINQLDMDLFIKDIFENWEQENASRMLLHYKHKLVVLRMSLFSFYMSIYILSK